METPIYHTEDGSLAYTSTRDKRCSGNAILSHPKQGDIIQTEYFFGPGRDPVIRVLQTEQGPFEVTVKGKWASRTRQFEMRDGECFEWSYASEKTGGKRVNLIVLRRVDGDGEKDREGRIIAQLVRSEEKRTAGTSRSRAGNGGELLVSEEGIRDVGEGLIIATCLSMLKREIDRRRAVQAAVIAGGAGS
ncbi:hypothetical protein MW887_006209 [Aspergillus wentii]|nr:hypothetical protein MW887_006209 [Aspergillus wentii]